MDESKLSKSDANRKPRELLIVELEKFNETYMLDWYFSSAPEGKREFYMGLGAHEVKQVIRKLKEVLPQDDSLRISREDWDYIKQQMFFPDGDDKYLHGFMERIERESRGEG